MAPGCEGRRKGIGRIAAAVSIALACAGAIHAADKLTDDEKIILVRDLTAEYAKAKVILPLSAKPLPFNADGTWDKGKWQQMAVAGGVAARLGDQVQITKVTLDSDKIVFEINGGLKSGRHWYDHVQAGVGTPMPVSRGPGNPTVGTNIELDFHKPLESLTADEVKKLLDPLLDFDKRSATKLYSETLPPEVAQAITEKRALTGMDRDQVVLALGHPDNKYRETKDGVESEDWIYGKPPGKITFVTFHGNKVVRVKDEYAGLGSDTSPVQ